MPCTSPDVVATTPVSFGELEGGDTVRGGGGEEVLSAACSTIERLVMLLAVGATQALSHTLGPGRDLMSGGVHTFSQLHAAF